MRRLYFLAVSSLVACEPPTPDVHIDFVTEAPLEVDTYMDQCVDGEKTVNEPYFSEEMCVAISVPTDDWYVEARQVSLDFQDYCVSYETVNESYDIRTYCNGMQVHLDAGEAYAVPLRAVSFDQKQDAFDAVSFNDTVVKATVTLYATNSWNSEEIEASANYDILMGDFDKCAGELQIVCPAVTPDVQ